MIFPWRNNGVLNFMMVNETLDLIFPYPPPLIAVLEEKKKFNSPVSSLSSSGGRRTLSRPCDHSCSCRLGKGLWGLDLPFKDFINNFVLVLNYAFTKYEQSLILTCLYKNLNKSLKTSSFFPNAVLLSCF